MNKLLAVLNWLDGKKLTISTVILLTNTFLGAKHFYDLDTMSYIAGMTTALLGGAAIATQQLGARLGAYRLGKKV